MKVPSQWATWDFFILITVTSLRVYFIVRSTVFSTSFSIWWNYTWCSYFLPPYLILYTRALAPLTFTSKDQDDYFSNITHESDYLLLLQHYPRKRLLLQHYPRTHVKIQLRNTFHFTIPGIHLFSYEQSVWGLKTGSLEFEFTSFRCRTTQEGGG